MPNTPPTAPKKKGWFRSTVDAVKCFFEWKMMWTRLFMVTYGTWAMYMNTIIIKAIIANPDNDNKLLVAAFEALNGGLLLVMCFYISKNSLEQLAEGITGMVAKKFGVTTIPATSSATTTRTEKTETQEVTHVVPVAQDQPAGLDTKPSSN